MNSILTINDVINFTKLSKTTIYGLIKQGQFPQQIKLSARRSGWTSASIDEWIQQKANAVRGVSGNV